MKKRLLIVGAGFGQIPAINKARELGIEVIVVDKDPNAPGMAVADHAYPVDVVDKDGVLEIAKKHQVNGVMTMQSDVPVPTIGYINDQLGLKGISYKTANLCSNKIETRKKFQESGCAQPTFAIADSCEKARSAADKIGYPCIIKAPDSSGSRGVIKVNAGDEVEAAFSESRKYTRDAFVLIEEYIEGLEFGAQTFSVNGSCHMVLLHNDILSQPPYMIPIGHSFPFKHLKEAERERAISDIKSGIQALNITDGPANIDLILDRRNNRVKIIEVGARIGATCLPELVYYHTGIDWIGAAINSALDQEVNLQRTREAAVAALIIESPDDGSYQGYDTNASIGESQLLEFEITATVNERVSRLRKGTDRIGKILTYGSTIDEAEEKAMKFRDSLTIKVA